MIPLYRHANFYKFRLIWQYMIYFCSSSYWRWCHISWTISRLQTVWYVLKGNSFCLLNTLGLLIAFGLTLWTRFPFPALDSKAFKQSKKKQEGWVLCWTSPETIGLTMHSADHCSTVHSNWSTWMSIQLGFVSRLRKSPSCGHTSHYYSEMVFKGITYDIKKFLGFHTHTHTKRSWKSFFFLNLTLRVFMLTPTNIYLSCLHTFLDFLCRQNLKKRMFGFLTNIKPFLRLAWTPLSLKTNKWLPRGGDRRDPPPSVVRRKRKLKVTDRGTSYFSSFSMENEQLL